MTKKILVTGATGFVGRQVINNLLSKKVEIRAIVRKEMQNFFEKKSKIELITTKDLFKENVEWWSDKCRNIDTVVHIAWYTKPKNYLVSSRNTDCLIGSLNLVTGAINAGIRRFVGIGTCFEYDLKVGDLSIKTPLKPRTVYAKAKTKLYKILSKLLPSKSIEFCWGRLFYLYGEGENEKRLVSYLHKQLSKGKVAKLSSGEQIRDFLNVKEAGKIIAQMAIGKQIGAINICSGIPITVRQLAEKIADKYDRRDLLRFGRRKENLTDPKKVVGIK